MRNTAKATIRNIEHVVEEQPEVQGHGAGRLARRRGSYTVAAALLPSFSTMNRFAKSTLPSASPIGGMITSSTSDFTIAPNARADDDADREVEHVAAHRERLEFLEHAFPPCVLGGWRSGCGLPTPRAPKDPPSKSQSGCQSPLVPPIPQSHPGRKRTSRLNPRSVEQARRNRSPRTGLAVHDNRTTRVGSRSPPLSSSSPSGMLIEPGKCPSRNSPSPRTLTTAIVAPSSRGVRPRRSQCLHLYPLTPAPLPDCVTPASSLHPIEPDPGDNSRRIVRPLAVLDDQVEVPLVGQQPPAHVVNARFQG